MADDQPTGPLTPFPDSEAQRLPDNPYAPGTPITLTIGDRTVTGRVLSAGPHMTVDPGPLWHRPPAEAQMFGPYVDLTVRPDHGPPDFSITVSDMALRRGPGEP